MWLNGHAIFFVFLGRVWRYLRNVSNNTIPIVTKILVFLKIFSCVQSLINFHLNQWYKLHNCSLQGCVFNLFIFFILKFLGLWFSLLHLCVKVIYFKIYTFCLTLWWPLVIIFPLHYTLTHFIKLLYCLGWIMHFQ
jgi:hypothetical protein